MNPYTFRRTFIALTLFAALVQGAAAAHGQEVSDDVWKAYRLRMDGKLDQARAALEMAIAANPGDAAAHYELARILVQMALADPGNRGGLRDRLTQAQRHIEQAEAIDPNNVIYPFFDGHIALLQAYPALMGQGSGATEKVARLCAAYELALKIKPDYPQAMLYLVEIFGTLEPSQGGNKAKAQEYARELEKLDAVYGAKARSLLIPQGDNNADYWQTVLKSHQADADVLEELGKAYLRADEVDKAVGCFDKAVKIDPARSYLYLDLSIYHTWAAMGAGRGSDMFNKALSAGDAAVRRYLDSEPSIPMRAYALGVQSKYQLFMGHKDRANALLKEAARLDRYYSKATGAPDPDLFIGPDAVSHNHRYLFRPVQ
jgi:tetratricopeptide (TPR) repeat protein